MCVCVCDSSSRREASARRWVFTSFSTAWAAWTSRSVKRRRSSYPRWRAHGRMSCTDSSILVVHMFWSLWVSRGSTDRGVGEEERGPRSATREENLPRVLWRRQPSASTRLRRLTPPTPPLSLHDPAVLKTSCKRGDHWRSPPHLHGTKRFL